MIRTKKMRNNFETANEAYEYFHDRIIQYGSPFGDTKALFNVDSISDDFTSLSNLTIYDLPPKKSTP